LARHRAFRLLPVRQLVTLRMAKVIVYPIRSKKRTKTHPFNRPAFMRIPALKFLLIGLIIANAMSSCVPLAIGAAGAAAGYIARDQGVGTVEPVESSNSNQAYDSYDPAVY